MVERIMKWAYANNTDKIIINSLITNAKIDMSKITDEGAKEMFFNRMEELEFLGYVTSATVGTDSHKEYYPSQKFKDELHANQAQDDAEEAVLLAREAEQAAILEAEKKKQEEEQQANG
jgi:hypothetical protein